MSMKRSPKHLVWDLDRDTSQSANKKLYTKWHPLCSQAACLGSGCSTRRLGHRMCLCLATLTPSVRRSECGFMSGAKVGIDSASFVTDTLVV